MLQVVQVTVQKELDSTTEKGFDSWHHCPMALKAYPTAVCSALVKMRKVRLGANFVDDYPPRVGSLLRYRWAPSDSDTGGLKM